MYQRISLYKNLTNALKQAKLPITFLKKIEGKECIVYNFSINSEEFHNNTVDTFRVYYSMDVYLKQEHIDKLITIQNLLIENHFFNVRVGQSYTTNTEFISTTLTASCFIE